MAKLIIGARVEINGVVLTDNAYSVEVHQTKPQLDTTNMTSAGQERILGLPDDSIVVNFHQDYAAADVDATLSPLQANNTAFPVKIRVTTAATSATNPEYQATCVLPEYSPLAGDVGTLATVPVTFPANGAIVKAIS